MQKTCLHGCDSGFGAIILHTFGVEVDPEPMLGHVEPRGGLRLCVQFRDSAWGPENQRTMP